MPLLFSNNGLGALASNISVGATSIPLVGGQGALFPAPANSFESFYIRIGSDASNEQVQCTARSGDTITCAATVGGWTAGDPVALILSTEVLARFPQRVTANTTVTLKSSGGDFTTLANLISAIQQVDIDPGIVLTVSIDDGAWSAAAAISDANFRCSRRIKWKGLNTYARSVSSVQSSSGSAGNWSITLNMSSVANIAVGDYLHVVTTSGGTNPTYLCGVHEVTNVDAVNTRITVTVKNLATSAPSGAVTSSATILKSSITFNSGLNGFVSDQGRGFYGIENLVIVGDASASTAGIKAINGGILCLSATGADVKVGVTGFPNALLVSDCSLINARYACCAGIGSSASVAYVEENGTLDIRNAVLSGGLHGLHAIKRGFADFTSGIVTGNNTNAITADKGGYVTCIGYTATSPTTLSPVANTVGNDNSYIDPT